MKILDYIKSNTLLIIPNSIKQEVLESFNNIDKLLNIKIMSLEELKKHVYFDYDEEAILYLMDKYKYNCNVSNTLLKNMYYIDECKYDYSKLNDLISLKNELREKKLLIYDNLFLNLIKNKEIIVYGYNNINKFYKRMLLNLKATIIEEEKSIPKKLTVYECDSLENEVNFVFNRICSLINDGIDINKIKLINVDEKYFYTIKRLSKLYNLPINIDNNNIYSSMIVKTYLNTLKSTKSIEKSIDIIKEKFSLSNEKNLNIYNILLNISNKYIDLNYNFSNIYNCINEDLKEAKIKTVLLNNQIVITDLENLIYDDYVFLLGFNQGSIPKLYKDEDYISDYYKKNILLETTEEKNMIEKEKVIFKLYSLNNLFITYKLKSIDSDFYPSNLVNELGMQILKSDINYLISYSDVYSKILLAKYLDDYIKYGKKSENISILYNNFKIEYLSYNNEFSGINNKKIINKLMPKLVLSYTHIDNYYHCAFKYYLSNVLKLDKFEEKFATIIGNLFHYVLSNIYSENFDFESEYDNYLKDIVLKDSEEFFINKLKKELKIIIDYIYELQKETGLNKTLLEQKIFIDKSSIIPVIFMGIVDKIMFTNSENAIASIVDYKTGNSNIDIYNTIYGLNMQLPIYLYLVKNSNLFTNVRFSGFYIQKILSSEVSYSIDKTYLEQKYSNLKLEGYSNSDISILERFIPDYENSKFVRGMKTSSKGFYPYTKVLDDEKIENLIELIDKKINEARDNILNAKFDINPKQIDDEKVGCKFCKYNDICYVCEKNYVKLKENKSLDFLGGDIDA